MATLLNDEPFKGFTVMSDSEFFSERTKVPDATGNYALFLRDATTLLEASGYSTAQEGAPFELRGHMQMYTGESSGVTSSASPSSAAS